jgi:hypothetical protein
MDVFVETGSSRVFATAIEWPGWSRTAKTEEDAIETLLAYRERYEAALGRKVRAGAPTVTERVTGDGNTDFGVPGSPTADLSAVDARQLKRLVAILESCWVAFDAAAEKAKGKTLATGPRGGGRTLAKIVDHHDEALGAYVMKLGGDRKAPELRGAFLDALEGRRRGDIEDHGPRGGARWTPREAVRRAAWHALDHAWEIEDRS